MQDSQNPNDSRIRPIGCDIGRARNHEFTSAGNPTGSTAFGKVDQSLDTAFDTLVDKDRSAGTIESNEVENRLAIRNRQGGPFELYAPEPGSPASTAARRLAKCALTSS